ncbi:hypothetical protein BCR33DRAFT_572323 [Rhizoclosmatium globosum]|uniref:Uncharacterized protein n=1 Tax=Rhizoclosmatium globosum TaxID=329046 RepID=A0A1Y2B507_9FUNG|nr:hypothetical protein BCR33DRAFT_572323 [Rhizoclosmatium globosum]|eukprot:ORY29922.1 hypothetical protein BCR33DRAFT_572323 [Rhizoclosmatium globosum]
MTADNLVLIENSTPKSTSLLLKARTHLLETHKTCSIIAPCTHSKTCPLLKTKSPHCLFPNPEPYTPKTAKLLHIQNIHSFTYLILSRNPPPQIPHTTPQTIPGRLIKTPLKRDGHVIMDACMPSGEIERHVVAKRHGKDVYRDARKSVWG